MKYGMNLLLWTGHVTSKQFPLFEKLKKVGYDGVEIPVFEGDEKHYASIKKELDKQGLKSTTVMVPFTVSEILLFIVACPVLASTV